MERGDFVPAAAERAAIRAAVLVAEGRHADALEAAGSSANHFALLASYEALTALGRTAEARQMLDRLFGVNNYGLDGTAVPVARYLYGQPLSEFGERAADFSFAEEKTGRTTDNTPLPQRGGRQRSATAVRPDRSGCAASPACPARPAD